MKMKKIIFAQSSQLNRSTPNLLAEVMRRSFRKVPEGSLQGDSEIPFGAFCLVSQKQEIL
jgi:hypothetical protein